MKPMRAALLLAAVLAAGTAALAAAEDFDIASFATLPVLHNGRVKPLDTVARSSLLSMRGKQTLRTGGRTLGASEWLLEAMAGLPDADLRKVFAVNDPDVLGLLGREQTGDKYYSFADLEPYRAELDAQARMAAGSGGSRDRFRRAVSELARCVELYARLRAGGRLPPAMERLDPRAKDFEKLAQSAEFRIVPPGPGDPPEAWTSVGESLMESLRTGEVRREVLDYAALLEAYRAGDAPAFNRAVAALHAAAQRRLPEETRKALHEAWFNRLQPFYAGMVLYLAVFLAGCVSWLGWTGPLRRAAYAGLVAALVVHTLGIFSRMVLQGRPPVTNLYSSAVFVGWVGALLSAALERVHRRGIAGVMGAAVGFCSLLIAHHLAMSGDTMEMMQAVLDSNFWLTVHVVTIIIGYGSMFLAAAFAHVYIVRGLLGNLDRDTARSLAQMTYGIVCFSLLFTLVGTILGGIWADQSWGRFWGWDPKENGALMMVLWQAVILHARRGGLIRERGLMVMSVAGGILTSLSWFGVNMLGVGMHSYGFMERALFWLALFVASQVAVMAAAALPRGPRA